MEDRLKGLKKSMDNTTFAQLQFTDQHRKRIRDGISKGEESEEEILQAVMQLLVQEKSGYELVKFLHGRGIRKYEDDEGSIYTLLHKLEQDGCLKVSWNESNVKYYQLNNRGNKLLRKFGKPYSSKRFALKELLGE